MPRVLSQKLAYLFTRLLVYYLELKSTAGTASAKASATEASASETATTEASAKSTVASAASHWEYEWGKATSLSTISFLTA